MSMNNLSSKTVAFVSNMRKSTDDKVTVIILHCTYCKNNYDTINNCWNLHFKLRQGIDKKRKNGRDYT